MSDFPKLREPENYEITSLDFQDANRFSPLLRHITDLSNSHPLRSISIDNIGIGNQMVSVLISSFEDSETYVPVLCTVQASVDLVENRGIHMSRCIDTIFSLSLKKYHSLDQFALEIARTIKESQNSRCAYVSVEGLYIHKRYTQKTHLASFDRLHLISHAEVLEHSEEVKMGMRVYNATGCPCTKTYMKYSVIPELKEMGLSLDQIKKIIRVTMAGTHMQVGTTELILTKTNNNVSYKDLYSILDTSLHLTYELLKRPDEHEFVKKVLQRPQFAEDAIREVAYETHALLKNKVSDEAKVFVEFILSDSIHIHNVRSMLSKSMNEIGDELKRSTSKV
jgi:GTP cyclohydrolase IV